MTLHVHLRQECIWQNRDNCLHLINRMSLFYPRIGLFRLTVRPRHDLVPDRRAHPG